MVYSLLDADTSMSGWDRYADMTTVLVSCASNAYVRASLTQKLAEQLGTFLLKLISDLEQWGVSSFI